jgi:fatty-acyl-CoA synthase
MSFSFPKSVGFSRPVTRFCDMRLEKYLAPRPVNYQPLTPVALLWRAEESFPDRVAVVDGQRCLTWAAFADFARRFAAALRRSGALSGEVVSVMAPNCLELLAAHYAVPLTGGVLNAINTRLDPETVAYTITHSECRLLVAHVSLREVVEKAVSLVANRCQVLWFGSSSAAPMPTVGDLLNVPESDNAQDADGIKDEWQPICINYTSGTTGKPKGVVYHHRGAYLNALGSALAMRFSDSTRYLWVLPMFHCNGWTHTWAVTAAGGTHVCLDRVDPPKIIEMLMKCRITHMCCAPVVLHMLRADPAFETLKLKTPVVIGTGGSAPTAKLISQLDRAGFRLVHLYGLTESFGPASLRSERQEWADLDSGERAALLASQGVPHATAATLRIIDGFGATVAADGVSVGEIVLQGNTVMAGYYKDEAATEQAFAGNVLHTGDLAVRRPDGNVEIRDRSKDIIISGGENIASIEVEAVLQDHAAVLQAAVVAMPHAKWGEVPCAFVELKAGLDPPSESALIAHCRTRLAGFKTPKKVVIHSIPRTATGKVQKYLLREIAASMRIESD